MHELVDFIVNIVGDMGYVGIYLMMTVESSFIPFPSEVAMIPAGYLASIGKMNFLYAFIAGTMGAMTGSIINYVLGFYLGGPIIKTLVHKYGKYIFLKEDHYIQAETYFQKHGSITTFLGRFIPAVRQLISVPAGIFKMNFIKFISYTFLGASIWNLVLMGIGYVAGENKDLIEKYSKELLFLTLAFVVIIGVGYYFINKKKKK
ncbi:DedA family protein [Candidatus Gracilibacteria bacterium]|nr:DedA family protein [Candidatus Gracilibacteria bacterium]